MRAPGGVARIQASVTVNGPAAAELAAAESQENEGTLESEP